MSPFSNCSFYLICSLVNLVGGVDDKEAALFARSFRRRFFVYHYAVNHPHTNIILS